MTGVQTCALPICHCPKCQGKNREKWIGMREKELLPVPYFHVVFTLPEVLNKTALHEPKMLYDILFESGFFTAADCAVWRLEISVYVI